MISRYVSLIALLLIFGLINVNALKDETELEERGDLKEETTKEDLSEMVSNITHLNSVLQEFIRELKRLKSSHKTLEMISSSEESSTEPTPTSDLSILRNKEDSATSKETDTKNNKTSDNPIVDRSKFRKLKMLRANIKDKSFLKENGGKTNSKARKYYLENILDILEELYLQLAKSGREKLKGKAESFFVKASQEILRSHNSPMSLPELNKTKKTSNSTEVFRTWKHSSESSEKIKTHKRHNKITTTTNRIHLHNRTQKKKKTKSKTTIKPKLNHGHIGHVYAKKKNNKIKEEKDKPIFDSSKSSESSERETKKNFSNKQKVKHEKGIRNMVGQKKKHNLKSKPTLNKRETSSETLPSKKTIHKLVPNNEDWSLEGDLELLVPYLVRKDLNKSSFKAEIEKCYAACKAAVRNGCRQVECSKKFKEQMKEISRISCIKEYAGRISEKIDKHRHRTTTRTTTSRFIDLSKRSWLYLPPIRQHPSRLSERDIIERIRQLSGRRTLAEDSFVQHCQAICLNAVEGACKKEACSYNKLNVLDRACQTKCNEVITSDWSSSSSSSSSSSEINKSGSKEKTNSKDKNKSDSRSLETVARKYKDKLGSGLVIPGGGSSYLGRFEVGISMAPR